MALTQVNPALLTGSSNTITTIQSNGTTAITINSSQAVSIGTTNVGGTLNTTTTSGNWGEIIYDSANNASMLAFRNNAGAAAGNISLSSAGATSLLMSSVAGVNFPATQVASSDANTLDDYEEGTWTPTLLGNSSNPTVSSSNVSGAYTKIGNLVTLRCSANFTFSGGSGSARIGGIPFVPSGTLSIGTLENGGVTMGGTYTWGGTLLGAADTNISLRKYSNANAGEADITIANQASGVWIRFTIQYQV